jgi:hypothetical protein
MNELKRLGRQKPDIYPPSCLEFRRSMADPDRFEERMLTLRQRQKRLQPPARQVATQRGEFTVLEDPSPKEPQRVSPEVIARGFDNIAREMGRSAG